MTGLPSLLPAAGRACPSECGPGPEPWTPSLGRKAHQAHAQPQDGTRGRSY